MALRIAQQSLCDILFWGTKQWGFVASQTYVGNQDYPVLLNIEANNTNYVVVVTRHTYHRGIGSITATPINKTTFNIGYSGYSSETITCRINWVATTW